jgi:hypothetical protein
MKMEVVISYETSVHIGLHDAISQKVSTWMTTAVRTTNKTPWPLVRKRNIVPTSADRGVSRGQRGGSPAVVNLSFLDRSR